MSTVKTFRKKPVEIQAMQFTGLLTIDAAYALAEWCGGTFSYDPNPGQEHKTYYWSIAIPTLEGSMTASLGDWIIRGVQGEFYPCKPDIFTQTYEQVSS